MQKSSIINRSSAFFLVAALLLWAVCASAQVQVSSPSGTINGHGYVDLGLSVKWAACNVGASSPIEIGEYYAWGEIRTKDEYTEENHMSVDESVTDISGDPRYDVARAKWGGSWRIPTSEEYWELIWECSWEWICDNVHIWVQATGPNGNSIVFHKPSCCEKRQDTNGGYWSSTATERDLYEFEGAEELFFTYYCDQIHVMCPGVPRYLGNPIRPVSD